MSELLCEFAVFGKPATQGSKVAMHVRRGGKLAMNPRTREPLIVTKDSNARLDAWRAAVSRRAAQAWFGDPMVSPVKLELWFVLPRPKSHFGTGRNSNKLKASAPSMPAKKPDLSKMARAVEDALTGIVYADDSQVCEVGMCKVYGPRPGVIVQVSRVEPDHAKELTEWAVSRMERYAASEYHLPLKEDSDEEDD